MDIDKISRLKIILGIVEVDRSREIAESIESVVRVCRPHFTLSGL